MSSGARCVVGAQHAPRKCRVLIGPDRYYLGHTIAPILTIVIGGNHEASNYMWELCVPSYFYTGGINSQWSHRYHGGWLAPNIYFLGFSGCVQVNGVRIAGSSGIYNSNHYNLGPFRVLTTFSHPFDVTCNRP